jgi:RNA recognition motif-containing protein
MSDAAIYVVGLPQGSDEESVKGIFGKYGTVVSCKVLAPHPQKTAAAAIVSMETSEKAKWCVDNVNGTTPEGLAAPLEVMLKNSGWQKEEPAEDAGALHVSGLPASFDDDQVKAFFQKFGPVKSVKVLKPRSDRTDAAAIVCMECADLAKTLIENPDLAQTAGLSVPLEIKAKLPSRNWGKGDWGFGGWGGGKGGGKGGYGSMMAMMQMQSLFLGGGKGGGKGWGGGGKGWGSSGLSSFPADKKVWVGGLPEDVTFQELREHFGGAPKAKFAVIMKGKGAGTGGVAFGEPADAAEAIASLNGSELKGSKIVVDVWTKKEKDEPEA